MNRIGRLSLPNRSPVCLLCQTQATRSSPLAGWQAIRSVGNLRQRRQAARMTLSSNVAKSSLKPTRSKNERPGPFAGMNRTTAHIPDTPRSRSQAALKRSGDPKDKDAARKSESPLYKALKMQTALHPVPYGRRSAVKSQLAETTNFDQFPLLPVVRNSIFSQALPGLVDVVPTPIQRLAIPALLKESPPKKAPKPGQDVEHTYEQILMAAETGSGKTLAYLIPLIDMVKRTEAEKIEQDRKEAEKKSKSKEVDISPQVEMSNGARPRVIILVPTAELVDQLTATVKAFSHTVKYRSASISSNISSARIKKVLFNPVGLDILVATPHLLGVIAKTEPYVLSRVSHLVLDEADSLMDRSFFEMSNEIIAKCAPSLQKLVLCSATITRALDNVLRKRFPDIKRLTTPNLHAIPRRVQLGVVDIQRDPYRGNRSLACADVIWSIGKAGDTEAQHPFLAGTPKVKKILVFVNKRDDAEELAQFLRTKGIDAQSFSRDATDRNKELLTEFTESLVPPTAEEIMVAKRKKAQENAIPFVYEQPKEGLSRRLPNTKVLVTTDLASRGIDTLPVKTVVLFDVPHNTIDFIHRLGRLGRMGKRGRAVVLVGKNDRKDVVKEVREGMFRGQALV
ncbi:putative ATP-dependent RNA helicase Mrh4 [Aspergillus heteromorphus CBS 117.55]|uniref:RNA helicase n=1 Tax=Aspergillus heteromorphus CBS 117.55 TaxID=1448321 RepID=A0A317V8J0_9EURO|nr:putative ATP-dependent RNA helicase Mrh4 [Aspergillus heteromorphus CBS 117.55]PWY70466.1 putative ATP-dependent RNA helicase Mrh4 [Aspergillus heteromorphus CBS 117.55]